MEKVLVCIYVPSIDMEFDVNIPLFLSMVEIRVLLSKMLEELTMHRYVSSGMELLCSMERNLLFQEARTLRDYNVLNGERLLFC